MFRSLFFIFTGLLFPSFLSAQTVNCGKWEQLVPSESIPAGVEIQRSNNNLDIIAFNGRYYFAFRTAPSHFASGNTHLYIISSSDMKNWTYEAEFYLGNDLREPRFLKYKGELFFYFFEGGSNPLSFHPKHIFMSKLINGQWTEPTDIGLDGYVPWRFRTRNDTAYLSAYYGVDLYKSGHRGDLRLFYSTDGKAWNKLSDKPQVARSGAEEGEFIFDENGDLWATIRLEGEGGMVCHAKASTLESWDCQYTPYKYDSALLFRHDGEIYLVSRRNTDGTLAKAPKWIPYWWQQKYNLLRYSITEKKTALFQLDTATRELKVLKDFPSTGDNAFPGITQKDENSYLLMNYSSDIIGRPKNWISGQLSKTFIYWTEMRFE